MLGAPKAPVTRRSAMGSSRRALGRLRAGTSPRVLFAARTPQSPVSAGSAGQPPGHHRMGPPICAAHPRWPQPSAKLKCSFATPRAAPISMFSGARRAACGPEDKSEVGRSGMNIEIGGRGRRRIAEKTAFKFRGGMSRIPTSILFRGNAFPSAALSVLPGRGRPLWRRRRSAFQVAPLWGRATPVFFLVAN